MSPLATAAESAHDVVGQYAQDKINGFTDRILDRMLDLADPRSATAVLDAMGGDGNLTLRLHQYCAQRGLNFPQATLLEFSRVQVEFARMNLARVSGKAQWGDVMTMTSRDSGERIPDGSFDRVLIKSGTHEIPLERQAELYASVFRVLKPGGLFVNLGFLYDDPEERDDFRELTRFKDTLVGMKQAAADRHFLTRDEFYSRMERAGFVDIRCGMHFDYTIHSSTLAEQYFKGTENALSEIHARQAKAMILRRKGRIRFEYDHSVLTAPGEITVARRPSWTESNSRAFRQCPYDFLRHLKCYRELQDKILRFVPEKGSVLDMGCGPGHLAARMIQKGIRSYSGFDISPEFVQTCRERYGATPGFRFDVGDVNTVEPGKNAYDAVTIINVLYLPGVDPIKLLRKAYAALKPHGRIIVSGPSTRNSFLNATPYMLADLHKEGLLEGNEALFQGVADANARLLPDQGNYWSAEGMIALLKELGFRTILEADMEPYYRNGYMVAAEK